MEEFILEPDKESLHRRAVEAAPFLRNRPGQVALVANRYPARPTVASPSIEMGYRALILAELVPIDQAGGPPSKQSRIEGRYTLPPGSPNSTMSVSPQTVGRRNSKVAVDQTFERIGYLTLVRAAPRPPLSVRDRKPLFAHDATHHLLRRCDRVVLRMSCSY